jgi:hypothetical protein
MESAHCGRFARSSGAKPVAKSIVNQKNIGDRHAAASKYTPTLTFIELINS